MTNLADFAARIEGELKLPVNGDFRADAKRMITAATEACAREHFWVNERRDIRIPLQEDQPWYTEVQQRTTSDIPSWATVDDYEWPFSDFPWTGRVVDIAKIYHCHLNDSSSQDWKMAEVSAQEMEYYQMQPGITAKGIPTAYALFGAQIGVYPIPDAAYTLILSATVKPPIPQEDADGSVFFTHCEELIRCGAKARLCRDVLEDYERAAMFSEIEERELGRLRRETGRKAGSRKIQPAGW